jgi:hypothetical protein
MRKVLIASALAAAGILVSAPAADAAVVTYVSFGGRVYGATTSTPATIGVNSVESPDKIMAGDSSGIQVTRIGQEISTDVAVSQTVTTATK